MLMLVSQRDPVREGAVRVQENSFQMFFAGCFLGCPICSTDVFHDIRVKFFKYRQFEGDLRAYKYMVKNIEITDTLTEKDLIEDILKVCRKLSMMGLR